MRNAEQAIITQSGAFDHSDPVTHDIVQILRPPITTHQMTPLPRDGGA